MVYNVNKVLVYKHYPKRYFCCHFLTRLEAKYVLGPNSKHVYYMFNLLNVFKS